MSLFLGISQNTLKRKQHKITSKQTRQTSAGQGKTLTLYTLGNEEQVDTIREWKTNQTVGVTHKGKSTDK